MDTKGQVKFTNYTKCVSLFLGLSQILNVYVMANIMFPEFSYLRPKVF
jgi:hypothetical protein